MAYICSLKSFDASMLRKNPPCIRTRSELLPGGRTRAWPTSSRAKLFGPSTKVRVTSAPPAPMPLRVSTSVLATFVVLICSVPLAERYRPYCSSDLKFVSRVATPQKPGVDEVPSPMSSTNRPEVAPTVPSLISLSWPSKVSVKSLRAVSISRVTLAERSTSGSSTPGAFSSRPPEISM